MADLERIQHLEERYLLQTYGRIPILLERGKGPYVFDSNGKRYLDFITGIGVNVLGYAHPRILKVMREQSARLIHSSNLYYNPYQGPLAQRLAQLSGMERAFFCNSGTEALEAALKLARLFGREQNAEKFEIVALDNSFHGRTYGALSVTGQPKYRDPYSPVLPGVRFVAPGDRDALTAAVGPQTCAILLEPIQGEGGVYELDAAYLAHAAQLAHQHNAALIFDEIQCGLGRTGKYFAYQWTSVVPDMVVTAKPIANGLPLGCLLARGAVANGFRPGLHGTTFGGGPLTCRVALEVLDTIEQDRLLENVQQMGAQIREGLMNLRSKFRNIRALRGRGAMWGIDLDGPAKPVVDAARELGLLANATHETVVRLLPPYILSPEQVDQGLRLLTRALKRV